ncbi:MAG TPA: hypothetical protein VGM19_07080 [Armatimonadota bacterium]
MEAAGQAPEAVAVAEQVIDLLLEGPLLPGAGSWPPDSALAITEDLYGAEGLRQTVDGGFPVDDYLLVSMDETLRLYLVEGVLLSALCGPRPFTVALEREDPWSPVNILASGMALCSTVSHVEFLESLPRNAEPTLLPGALEACSLAEQKLAAALEPLPEGWRSVALAISAWREIDRRAGERLRPSDPSLLAAVCYLAGPWRLTPLLTAAQWQEQFGVGADAFLAAWHFLDEVLDLTEEIYRYLPRLSPAELAHDPEAEGSLMELVHGFLESLEDEPPAPPPPPVPPPPDDGLLPLFPDHN